MPVKLKASDETRNNTAVVADDATLQVSLAASSTYLFDICLVFNAAAASQFRSQIVYTGTLIDALGQYFGRLPVTAATGATGTTPRAFPINATTFTTAALIGIAGSDTAGTVGVSYWRGIIRTNSAGTFKVQWSQNISNAANTTLQAGSYLQYQLAADLPGTLLVKTTSEVRSNTTTFTADSDLQFPIEAGKSYICELMFVESTTSTPRFKHRLTDAGCAAAVGGTCRNVNNVNVQPSAAQGSLAGGWEANCFTVPLSNLTTTFCWQNAWWAMTQDTSDDVVALEWAQQNLSATTVTMQAPSYLYYEEVV